MCIVAAAHNVVSTIEWALSQKSVSECLSALLCTLAALWGHTEVMDLLYFHGFVCTKEDILLAAIEDNKNLFDWAREKGHNWDVVLLAVAAKEGNGRLIRWGMKNWCAWSKEMIENEVGNYIRKFPQSERFSEKKKECILS